MPIDVGRGLSSHCTPVLNLLPQAGLDSALVLRYRLYLLGIKSSATHVIGFGSCASGQRLRALRLRIAQASPRALQELARSKRSQEISDFNQEIELRERILILRPKRLPEHTLALRQLAVCLHERFKFTQDPGDINRDVKLSDRVLALHPEGHPEHPEALRELTISLSKRFTQSQDRLDVNRAIRLGERRLALCHDGNPDHEDALLCLFGSFEAKRAWQHRLFNNSPK